MKRTALTAAIVAVAFISAPAYAAVIGGAATGGNAVTTDGGTFINLGFSPPAEVGDNNQQNSNLYAFNEDQNIVLDVGTGTIDVDCLVGGGLGCSAGTLGLGTTVASHYVYFDPDPTRRMIGNVVFDAPILAVIDSTGLLAASDFLINNSVTYNSPGLRGLEAFEDSYSIGTTTLTGDTFFLNWRASDPGDYVRVLTAFSPVADSVLPGPGAAALLGLGLVGFAAFRRRVR